MPRAKKHPFDHRKPVSFTLTAWDIKRLDDLVESLQRANPLTQTSRQTILEGLLLERLDKEGGSTHAGSHS